MRLGDDIAVRFPGLFVIHQNIPGKEVGRHAHEEHLLFLPLQGEIQLVLEDRTLAVGRGRMLYLPAETPHAFTSSHTQGERLICMIEDRAWKKANGGRFPPSTLAASQLCKELLFFLLLHPETKAAGTFISTLILSLNESMEASSEQPELGLDHLEGRAQDPRLRKALQLIRARMSSSVGMEKLAKDSGLSVRSMNRLFLTELSISPKQALTQARIARASELLGSGKQGVTEAAFEVGYRSLPQFIANFRALTGQLPSEVARASRR